MKSIKIKVKLLIRFYKDFVSGVFFKFVTKQKTNLSFNHLISISQEIKPSETFDNKIFNLTLASKKINPYCLMPNEVFSFWKIIGNPNKNFKKGRAIQNGKLIEENGGGLCQVSGILHHACLIAGLQILERHNHSVDIYTDKTRFTPLGLDATVVYGYKDFRIKNNYDFPIKFAFEVNQNQIKVEVLSTEKIEKRNLYFESENIATSILVRVLDNNKKLIHKSIYKKMSNDL